MTTTRHNTTAPNTPVKRTGGMARLGNTLTARTAALAQRSTEEDLTPSPPGQTPTPTPPAVLTDLPPGGPAAPATPAFEPSDAPNAQNTRSNGPSITTVSLEPPPNPDDHRATAGAHTPAASPPPSPDPAPMAKPARSPGPRKPTRMTLLRNPPLPTPGPEGRLEASGEPVVKWTIELAPQLVRALAIWERDETNRTGQRVFRERVLDLALDTLPHDLDDLLTLVSALPATIRTTPGEQFGTRVRLSVRDKLMRLRPELRVAGVKDVRMRHIYSAGVYRYLLSLGLTVEPDTENTRTTETENAGLPETEKLSTATP